MQKPSIQLKQILLCVILFFITHNSNAQAPQKLWDAFFNGALSGKGFSRSVVTDNAGNVFVTGISYQSSPLGNFSTIKYDSNGAQLWADHYGTAGTGTFNGGKKLVIDKNGYLYAMGTAASNDGDIAVVKYSSNGKVWSKIYEPYWFGSDHDFGVDIVVDTLNNFYFTGQVTSLSGNLYDSYFAKCDSAGTIIYYENYTSASGDDYPAGVAVTNNGNFFGLSNSFNFFGSITYDIFTINYLPNGYQNWISRYNNPVANGTDYGMFIKVDQSNNQFVCGTAEVTGNNDMVVMKQNNYGTRLWTTTYNGTANGNDTAMSTTWLPNGFVVVTGRSKELLNGNTVDAMVTMVIDSGTIVNTHKFYGSDNLGARPAEMTTDAQGNIYVCGTENLTNGTTNGCIVKYDSNGNFVWNITYDAGVGMSDAFNSIVLDLNNDIVVTGQTYTGSATSNYLTVKYANSVTGLQEKETALSNAIVYPNPAAGNVTLLIDAMQNEAVAIYIVDVAGREIKKWNANLLKGSNKLNADVGSLKNGMYTISINGKGKQFHLPLSVSHK